MHYKVISHLNIILCFESQEVLNIGDLVSFILRKKKCIGIIILICNDSHKFALNELTLLHRLGNDYAVFIQQFSYYYCCHPYSILKNIQKMWSGRKLQSKNLSHKAMQNIILNDMQEACVSEYYIKNTKPILLWGVTGSGKTEVAIQIAINAINNHQQVLILVPEIALTTNLVHRFQKYFNIDICIWNSQSQTKGKFQSIINGKSKLIIGARSAVLLPYMNLGLIIIDEEHDKSYKQMSDIHYCTIKTAIMRHNINYNVKILLMSATPSLSSLYHTTTLQYNLLKLNNKFYTNKTQITTLHTPNNVLLNQYSQQRLNEECSKGHQVMIFLNRRGFAHTLLCKICNFVQKCLDCESNIIYHYDSTVNKSVLICHKCNRKYTINKCVNCDAMNHIGIFGYGVEKIASMLKNDEYNIGIFDSDYCDTEMKITEFLDKVKTNEINVIIGTQMLSKGHDFANLSLVIIFMYNLCSYDFKMQENLMQNLMQISGRVGRNNLQSEVIIQTPDTNTKYNLTTEYYEEFLYKELQIRKTWNLSPYTITIYITPQNKIDIPTFHDILRKSSLNIYTSKDTTLILIVERSEFHHLLELIHNNFVNKYKFQIDIND